MLLMLGKVRLSANTLHGKGAFIYDVRREGGRGVQKCSKFVDKQYRFCGQREGGRRGGKQSQNYVDIINGSPEGDQTDPP